MDPNMIKNYVRVVVEHVDTYLASYGSLAPDSTALRTSEKELDEMKASLNLEDAIDVASGLLSPVLNDVSVSLNPQQMRTVHFGFHVIDERALVTDWAEAASADDKKRLRDLALNLLVRCSIPSARACFPSFVRAKVAALLVALAIREWPGLWPQFVKDVAAIGGDNPGCRDIVCDIFKSLSDEVHEFGDRFSSKRRASLSKALKESVDDIIAFVTACGDHYFNAKDEDGLCGTLSTFESILSWCSMEKALRLNVPSACLSMLVHEGRIRTAALEALAVFCSRKPLKRTSLVAMANDRATVMIREKLFPGLLEAVKTIPALRRAVSDSMLPGGGRNFFAAAAGQAPRSAPENVDSDDHEFLARFMYVVAELGVSHFGLCFLPFQPSKSKITDDERRIAFAYIELMLCAIAHPSTAVKSHPARYFSTAFVRTKKKKSSSNKSSRRPSKVDSDHGSMEAADATEAGRVLMSSMVLGIVDAAPIALLKHPNDGLVRHFADIDFEGDGEELSEVRQLAKHHVVLALSHASAFRAVESVSIALHRLSSALELAVCAGQSNESFFAPSGTVPSVGVGGTPVGVATQGSKEQLHSWGFPSFGAGDGTLVLALMDAVVKATEPVVASASSVNVFAVGTLAVEFQGLFDKIASIKHAALQAAKVGAFKIFIPLFIEDKSRLTTALNVLVSIVSLDGHPTRARRLASHSLAALCRRVTIMEGKKTKSGAVSSLAEVRQPLCEFVAPVLVSSNRHSLEKAQLLEAAMTCLLTLSTMDEKAQWMYNLLRPLLDALDPSQEWFQTSFQSQASLIGFMDKGHNFRQTFFQSLFLVQSSTHQVVRRASKQGCEPISLPNPLSQSIAPRCIDMAVQLIPVLHSMYNLSKGGSFEATVFPSMLLPTSREVSAMLNLTDASFFNANSAPEVDLHGIVVDTGRTERDDDLLRQVGIDPPSTELRRTRETLRLLRSGAYELVRNSILSGVTQSPDHMQRLLGAITTDYQYLEPLHLFYLVQRVVVTLLCKAVVSADGRYLVFLAESQGLIGIVGLLLSQIEAISSSTLSTSNNPVLDISREHGRLLLPGVSIDLFMKCFGNVGNEKTGLPVPVFMQGETPLSSSLWGLLKTLCSPIVVCSDFPASRSACGLVQRSAATAGDNLGVIYGVLLVACFQSDVYTYPIDPLEICFTTTVLEVAARFPVQSTEALGHWIRGETNDVQTWIKTAFTKVLAIPEDKKEGRKILRDLVQRISVESGLASAPKKNITNPKVELKKKEGSSKSEDVELVLGDEIVDSLFGSGPSM